MLNEHDLKDWIRSDQPKPLYDVPRDTIISLAEDDTKHLFSRIDGMYSLCYTLAKEVFHLAAWTPVFTWQAPSTKQGE